MNTSAIRKLIEITNDKNNDIKNFRNLVDYALYMKETVYLESLVKYPDFFKEYLNIYPIFIAKNEDTAREKFLDAIEKMKF